MSSWTLSPSDLRLLPTDLEIDAYNTRGFHVVRGLFSDAEIADAVHGVQRYYAGERDFALSDLLRPFEGARADDSDPRRLNDYASLQIEELARVVFKPILSAIAARLAGVREIRLWHDQLIRKSAQSEGTSVGWHTDRSYWATCTSLRMLTAFIPLQDINEEMGPLKFLEGSHTWNATDSMRGFHDRFSASMEGKVISMCLARGDVSFHHCRTIHGSGPNRSTTERLSLSVHLQDGDNAYQIDSAKDAKSHFNDMLCRKIDGQPDYSDPDICPVLWRET